MKVLIQRKADSLFYAQGGRWVEHKEAALGFMNSLEVEAFLKTMPELKGETLGLLYSFPDPNHDFKTTAPAP